MCCEGQQEAPTRSGEERVDRNHAEIGDGEEGGRGIGRVEASTRSGEESADRNHGEI